MYLNWRRLRNDFYANLPIYHVCTLQTKIMLSVQWWRSDKGSHHCGPDSIPRLRIICGLSLLVRIRYSALSTLLWEVFPWVLQFSPLLKNVNYLIWSAFLINNYWMRWSMISWIIKAEVCVICRSRRLRQITQTGGFDNSWYHAKTEFNNCFIIHFSHNSSSETEAKRSAILFLRRTLQGA